MTTWRDFDLTHETQRREFERQMAQELGYYIYHYDKDVAPNCYYMLMLPDGGDGVVIRYFRLSQFADETFGIATGERQTEEEAWGDVPRWLDDREAAMLLVEGRDLALCRDSRGWWATLFGVSDLLLRHEPAPRYRNEATAITVAFCEWKEAEIGNPEG